MLMKKGKVRRNKLVISQINIFNLVNNPIIIKYCNLIKKIAKYVLKSKKNIEVNIIFVGNTEIKKLNKKYLGRNKVTDVIAFNSIIEKRFSKKEKLPFGDIYICVDQAKKQAKIFGISLISEILILIAHGCLHLLGYKDYNLSDRIKMSEQTLKIIKKTI